MPRSCSASRAGRSTTAFATGGFRRFGRSADRSACSSTRCRTIEARPPICRRAARLGRHTFPLERPMAVPVNRTTRLLHLNGSLAAALVVASLAFAAAPAAAAHRARLSADLADHLAAGSQTIRVIVHGTRAEVDALAARYNLTVAKLPAERRGAAVNAGQLAAMRQDDAQDHLSGDIRIRSSVDAADVRERRRRSGVGRRRRGAGADRPGDRGRGDRLGDRHRAQRAQGARAGDARLHRRRRPGPLRARHARGGDHRRPARARRSRRGTTAASRRARICSTCACSATTGRGR